MSRRKFVGRTRSVPVAAPLGRLAAAGNPVDLVGCGKYYWRMSEEFDARRIYPLENVVQTYAWGSTTAIPELLGRANPKGVPHAELWMGAHPKAPSKVRVDDREESLEKLIRANPEPILGKSVVERFGPRLPFLFKVLAAAKALSIQAHPNVEEARAGYRRENEAGISLDAPERNYRDENHKPEVLCALSDFWAMRGFRPIDHIRADLAGFRIGLLGELGVRLDQARGAEALRGFLRDLLEMNAADARTMTETIALQSKTMAGERFRWVERLTEEFPGDVGATAPLFLNVVHLNPGEATYQKAGELHAYLEGTGVELMANSDNVLRGGLTSKHVDVSELLSVLSFETGVTEPIRPEAAVDGSQFYRTPTAEFRLSRIGASRSSAFCSATNRNVEILLCIDGGGTVRWSEGPAGRLALRRGQSLLVPSAVASYELSGDVVLFRADVPQRTGEG